MKTRHVFIFLFMALYVGCVSAPGHQYGSGPGKTFSDHSDSAESGPSFGERLSRALGAMGQGFSSAGSRNGGQCNGSAPMPPMGCKMVCLDGRWQSVCN